MGILMYNGEPVGQVGVKNKVTVNGVTGNDLGTATVNNVLDGVTFTSKEGVCIEGIIPNNGAWVTAPTESGQIIIPEGYHDGNGYVDTSAIYEAGVTDGSAVLGSGQGIVVKNTTNLHTPSSSSTDGNYTTVYSWTNPYGAGKVYVYMKTTAGSSNAYASEGAIYINGSKVKDGSKFTYYNFGATLSAGGIVRVAGQGRFGVTTFMLIFVKD